MEGERNEEVGQYRIWRQRERESGRGFGESCGVRMGGTPWNRTRWEGMETYGMNVFMKYSRIISPE